MMGYDSSSSNLSPLAPLFPDDRFTLSRPSPRPNPLPYPPPLIPSFHSWFNTNQPISRPDLYPTPNPEFDPLLPPISSTSYVLDGSPLRFEVNPYYPPYVSSSVGDVVSENSGYHLLSDCDVLTSTGSFHNDYLHSLSGLDCVVPQQGGLWGKGLADWPLTQSNQVQPDGSFCPKESCSNQGFYSCGGLTKYKEGSLVVGVEKHSESTSSRELDPKFFFGDSKFISPDFSTTRTLASASGPVIPRTGIQVPHRVNFKDPEAAFSNPYEQCFSSFDTWASGSSLHLESSPAVVSAPPLHDAGTFNNVKSGDRETSKDFFGRNVPFMRESYPHISSGGKNYFDDSTLESHLEATAHDFTEFVSTKNEELPSRNGASKDVPNSCSSEQHAFQVSQTNLDDLHLIVDGPKVVDCSGTYSWNADHLGYSPCWKGAPASHLTPFEVSETANLWGIGKVEDTSSPCMQSEDIFTFMADDSVKVFVHMPSESSVLYDNVGQENIVVSPSKRPIVADLLHEGGIDDSVNCGLKLDDICEIQNSNVIHKVKGESAAFDKFMGDSDEKVPKTKEQGLFGELISEKPIESEVANADSVMCGNCNLDCCSYNVPFNSTDRVYSRSSSEDVRSKVIESHMGESRPQISIQMLVNTIHNLSELLLFHCSNGTCEMNEEERVTLKSVIENIDACVPNKVERMASTQESLVCQSATSSVGSSPELQKGPLENQQIQEHEHDTVSIRKEENLFKGVFSRTVVDMVKEENRTQAIKKILAEHFKTEGETEPDTLLYKNLWLEAEALLCSVNYMARFNRMKSEIEQNSEGKSTGKQPSSLISSSPQISNTLVANTINGPISRTSFPDSTILKVTNLNDVRARHHILKLSDVGVNSVTSAAIGESSSCNVFLNLNKDEKLEHEAKDNLKTQTSINDSPVSSSTCHAADNEASAMARFQILKNRCDEPNSVNKPTMDKIWTSLEIPDLNNVSQWADEVQDAAKGDAPIKPLLTSTTSSLTSYDEASVLASFQVPKQQGNKTVPHNHEEHHLHDDECYGYVDLRRDGLNNDDGSEDRMINVKVGELANVTDLCRVGQSTKDVKQAAGTFASKKHLQMLSTRSPADDVDASVVARFHVLMSQYDNSSAHNKELKLCDDNCGLAVWRRSGSTGRDGSEDKMVDVKLESERQNHAASSTDGRVMLKEFHLFAKGDPINQHGSTSGHADKSDAGWCDNFSSDWEHVLKEDFANINLEI